MLQDVLSENSPFLSGQHNGSIVFDENGPDWKQGGKSSRQGSLGIRCITEDHNYCRVSDSEIECESRFGVQEFSGFQQIVALPKGISNDQSK